MDSQGKKSSSSWMYESGIWERGEDLRQTLRVPGTERAQSQERATNTKEAGRKKRHPRVSLGLSRVTQKSNTIKYS